MTLDRLKSALADALKARQAHLDNANAAQGAVMQLEILIKEEEAQPEAGAEETLNNT